ncbi:unnamed protein product [Camellia sinensis]
MPSGVGYMPFRLDLEIPNSSYFRESNPRHHIEGKVSNSEHLRSLKPKMPRLALMVALQPDATLININAKELTIVWGNDNRYWRTPKESNQPAELLQVCWLEVTGSCVIDKGKKYNVTFEVSLTPDAFGWNNTTLYIMAKRGEKGRYTWKKVNLTNQNTNKDQHFFIPEEHLIVEPDTNASDDKLYFGLYEIWKGNWKGGLKIYRAVVETR